MKLFSAAINAPVPSPNEDLQKKISALESRECMRRKYGASCTNEQLAEYAEEERKEAALKKRREEAEAQGRIAARERLDEIKTAAVRFVQEGRILVALDGVRMKTITTDLSIACPDCEGEIRGADGPLFDLTEKLHDHPESARFAIESGLVIPAARNPLSSYCGGFLYLGVVKCNSCQKASQLAVQVALIV